MDRKKFTLFAVFLILNLWVVGQRKVSINSLQGVYIDTTDESLLKDAKGSFGVSVSTTNETCSGACDGTITITLTGTPTYPVKVTITPPSGPTPPPVTGLQATDFPFTITGLCGSSVPYSIRVTDNDNIKVNIYNIYILAPAPMTLEDESYAIINESCAGKCDGEIDISYIANAQGNTYYLWSNGSTEDTLTNLCAGTYTVTVTDDMGCTEVFPFDVTAPPVLQVDSLVFNPVFCNGGTGSITVYASGGNPPFAYDIGGGYQVGNVFNGLAAGTYTVTIIDGNACTAVSAPATLTENSATVLTETHVDVGCFGASTGSVDLTVNGGTSPYTYSWQGPGSYSASSQDINNLAEGTYNVTVTDKYSCTSTLTVIINSAVALNVSESHTNVTCNTGTDGSITLTVSGGTVPYTYNWTGPSCPCSGASISNLSAGTYNVTITDNAGCSSTMSIDITEPTAIVVVGSITNVECFGQCTGAVDITVNGGVSPYTYTWSGPSSFSSTSEDLTNLCAGTYWVTIKDANNCTRVRSFQVISPPDITITAFVQDPSCSGLCNGLINLNVNGGTPTFTYLWSNGQTSQNLSALCAGTYSVTVTDSKGCTKSQTYVLTDPAGMTLSEIHVDVTCHGYNNGSIDLTVAGTYTNPLTYNWTGPNSYTATSQDINALYAGTYNVTVTDGSSCSKTLSVTLAELSNIALSATVINVSCSGGSDASIDITPSGGIAPYTFSWTGPAPFTSTNEDLTNIGTGTYNLTVTDALGCHKDTSFTITQPYPIIVTHLQQNVTCFGLSNGAIDLTVTDGNPPYSYNWSGPSCPCGNNQDLTNLLPGTYNVTITDVVNCTQTYSVTITQPNQLAVSESHTNIQCFGQTNGTITLTPSGGTSPYTYNWTGPSCPCSGASLTNLAAGTYNVTLTDANGCSVTQSITLTQPASALSATESHTNVSCFGGNNGSITLTVSGGTSPYTYNWTGPSCPCSGNSLTNLTAGTYNVTITDANSCTTSLSITISQPASALSTTESHTNVSCFGGNNGSITLTVSGGTSPYTYNWTGPSCPCSGNSLTNLTAGTYAVTVMDANNCTTTRSITITQPATALSTTETHTNVSCFGGNNGSITLSVSGGTSPYTYNWTGPSCPCSGNSLTNLTAGTYNVTVTDANSCTSTLSITITQPASALSASETHTNVSCFDGNNGSITLTVSGGTSPYTYNWTGPSCPCSGNSLTNLTAGTYNVTVSDANSCTTTLSILITEPADITLSESHSNISCYGQCTGTIDLTVSGGTAPYSYNWTGTSCPCFGTSLTNLCAGAYSVTVTDANACTKALTINIIQPSQLVADITSQTNMSCGGGCSASATVTVSGGTPNYSYLWSNGEWLQTDTALCVGWNYVTVTDAHGCTAVDSTEIIAPPVLSAEITDSTMSCGGAPTGVLGNPMFIPDGPSCPNLCYQTTVDINTFAPGATLTSASDLLSICVNIEHSYAGDLSFRLMCPNGQSVLIDSHDSSGGSYLGIPIDDNGTSSCLEVDNPMGTGWTYCWSSVYPQHGTLNVLDGGVSPISPTDVTNHTNYITPENPLTSLQGCPLNGTWTMEICDDWQIDNGYVFWWEVDFAPSLYPSQYCNGSATVTPAGGQAPYTYMWSNGETSQTITDLCSGDYCVTVTDANNCTSSDCVTIVDVNLTIDSITKTNASCNGVCNGTATVYSSNGFAPILYNWSNGDVNQTADSLCAGTYYVTVSEVNGCTAVDSVVISNGLNLVSNITTTNTIMCHGDCTAGAVVLMTNGQAPYTYNWSPNTGDTGPIISNMCEGTYNVTITDANGCTTSNSVTFTAPLALTIDSAVVTNEQPCNSSNNGSVTIYVSGGTIPYQYNLGSGNQASNQFNNLPAGTYTPTITDANNCTFVGAPVIITEPPVLVVNNITSTDVTPCLGSANGTVTITVSGGVAPYQYDIGGGNQASNLFNGLSGGSYIVTVTDNLGCTIVSNAVTINEPTLLTLDWVSQTDVACNGAATGTLVVTGNGGVPGYTYTWTGPSCPCSGNSLSNLAGGLYFATVTDNLGCTATNMFEIIDTSNLKIDTLLLQNPLCSGQCNGAITVSGNGGLPSYTYTWDNGLPSQPNQSNLCAGTYNVTVYDANMCSRSASITLTNPLPVQDSITLDQPIICNSQCDAIATVHPYDGIGTYSYQWDDPASSVTATVSNLCVGTYHVTISDGNSCTKVDSITISQPTPLANTLTQTQAILCYGQCNAQVTSSVSGGVSPYTYTWSGGTAAGSTDNNICAGWLFLTVTDASTCSKVDSINISQPDSIQITFINVTNVNCHGDCSGQATAQITGGTGAYGYLWDAVSHSQTTVLADSLCAGFHYVTVTDINGCTNSDFVQISDTSNLNVSIISQDNPLCYGGSDGQITVTGTGGFPDYSYLWEDNSTDSIHVNLTAGTYLVTVLDARDCSHSLMIDLVDPPQLLDSITLDNPISCYGTCDAAATVAVWGGTPPYTYQWNNGANSNTIFGLCQGTYYVTIIDANGCNRVDSITIEQPDEIINTLTIIQPISCFGTCDGTVQASVSGGTPPYTYTWSNGDNSASADSLCIGWVYVTVLDSRGCNKTDSIELTQPDSLSLMVNTTPVSCGGLCDGTAFVLVSGGTAPYTYLWSANAGNQITPIIDSLCADNYSLTVTDAHGCSKVELIAIMDTSHLKIDTLLLQQPLCAGQCNGAITVAGSGGVLPYGYSWDNGLPSQPGQTNLCAGSYTVTVQDGNLCKRWVTIDLANPPALTDSIQILQTISCNSSCDGSVAVFPVGGTGTSYTYDWDDPLLSHNDTLTFLCAGTYHVTISDVNSCTITDSVSLASPPALSAAINITQNITCFGMCNGIVDVTMTGGTPPYVYAWSNGDDSNIADSLCGGWIYLTVTDAALCQKTDSVEIIEPDSISLSFTNITTIACGGNCTGTATVVATGGTGAYNYQWDANAHNQTTDLADSLCVNIYFVTVGDANGCTAVGNVSIIDTSNLSLNITDIHNISCAGTCDGSANASMTGGTLPYTYSWNTTPAQTDSTAINLCAGTYMVTVSDMNLCMRVEMVDITDVDILAVQDSVIPVSCTGLCDASIILIPSGGTPPYVSYAWSIPGETDSIASGLCPGTYYYTVTDANDCVVSDSVTITDPGAMSVSIDILHAILCHNDCNGSIGITVNGALGPYTYEWSNGSTDSVLVDLCAGLYEVTVTGIGGCSSTASVTLINPDSLQVLFTNIIQVNCGGDCSGRVTAFVSGGTPPYNYLWDGNAGNATTPTIDSLCANLYFITITDDNGCGLNSMFEVTDTSHLELHIVDSSMVSCYGRCDGWAQAQAQSGYIPYSYLWNTTPQQDTTSLAQNLCAGMYLVTVTDFFDCSRVRLVTITQPDSLYINVVDSSLILCYGVCDGSITVSPVGGTLPYNLFWSNSSTDTLQSALCAGLYTATLTDAHNCTDSLHYLVTQPAEINDSTNVITSLCSTGSNDGSVNLIISGGTSPYHILWSTQDTIPQLDSLMSGTYYYTVTDANGCSKNDSVFVQPMIVVNATAKSDTIICYGDSVQIFGFGGAVYFWTPGTGLSDSTSFEPFAKPTETTTYYFTVYDSICFDIDSVTIGVFPQITIDAGQDQSILYDHSTSLNGTCSDINATFLWIPATGLEDSASATTIAHPLETTTYYLYATNANGCIVVDSVTITVIPKIRIPSGFTPNGDGTNDAWEIDLIELFPNCEVYVYNRWGEKLFYSKGYPPSERWDGKYNGKDLPSGTYYYIINLHDEAYPDPITGPITIMR